MAIQDGILESIPHPTPWPDTNKRLLLGQGAAIDPLDRLASFTDEQFERFIWEWVSGYLSNKYTEVQHRGRAGDKGRDVIGWLDDSSAANRRWHLYQCKKYKDPLTPSEFLVELGKLCHYSFRKHYTVPDKYYIVSPKGVGNSLQDLIDSPSDLRAKLIEKWDLWCRDQITASEKVGLVGDFSKYVEAFDFSIVKTVAPETLIEQHKQTKYHLAVFGSSFKPRPPANPLPVDILPKETIYVSRIYEAFSDHVQSTISSPEDFEQQTHLRQ